MGKVRDTKRQENENRRGRMGRERGKSVLSSGDWGGGRDKYRREEKKEIQSRCIRHSQEMGKAGGRQTANQRSISRVLGMGMERGMGRCFIHKSWLKIKALS
jgi:hypothetical protein